MCGLALAEKEFPTLNPVSDLTSVRNANVSLQLSAFDEDRDRFELTYSAINLPAGLSVDPEPGSSRGG
jgi:hypothetical protein